MSDWTPEAEGLIFGRDEASVRTPLDRFQPSLVSALNTV